MSITIIEQDNLNVIISLWEIITQEKGNGNPEKDLRIFINILVNGKLKQLFQTFKIDKLSNWGYKIVDLPRLSILCDTISQLWYDVTWFYPSFEKWLLKL